MKVEPSVETYQAGAHFKALIKANHVAPSRILEIFFSFLVSLPRCVADDNVNEGPTSSRLKNGPFVGEGRLGGSGRKRTKNYLNNLVIFSKMSALGVERAGGRVGPR